MTIDAHDLLVSCRDCIHQALIAEMSRRPENHDWIERERHAVADAATAWAVKHRFGRVVSVEDVERVEGMAVGHSDYGPKLALYVAELVVYPRRAAP